MSINFKRVLDKEGREIPQCPECENPSHTNILELGETVGIPNEDWIICLDCLACDEFDEDPYEGVHHES